MFEKERLAEAAALFMERERKMTEVLDIERRIRVALGIGGSEKRKKAILSDHDMAKVVRQ